MEHFEIDSVVIGAGVIGLATARALALSGRETWVLEADTVFGSGISSRNSEVIHAGIYYPEKTLKAQLCVQGKALLYDYVSERGIPHKKCGKMIVAQNAVQEGTLEKIQKKAQANGVEDLTFLSARETKEKEPELACTQALFSPSTGIIDTHSYMLSLLGDFENAGGQCVYAAKVMEGEVRDQGIILLVQNKDTTFTLSAKSVVNAAGLAAVPIARSIKGLLADKIPPCYYAKGHYFALNAKNPFQHLIYPVPEKDGLGVHLTLDMGGKAKFGPDVQWVDEVCYNVPQSLSEKFYPIISQYWPNIPKESLIADYAGIRPKIHAPDDPAADFMIQSACDHGVEGLINLFGIESPGITASLAIAQYATKAL